ncbi:hypothetical protein PRIPAC_91960 [Pristionchus pacificus]|uniref:Uncharacterized protein n=1 Tax=Pristionchus pacificus TaxID=54126 RepID=A0A2A6BQF9_PRIPA|nr:hypothetical protein PRIPAC_91960 [Pristionchus pacificus]|eukprot:PDM68066.1 hypothetical protein PRIPAC_46110 [Pristionchus pacificus]
MPAWTAVIPLLIPLAAEVIRCIDERRADKSERERELLEDQLDRMQANLDAYRCLQKDTEMEREAVVRNFDELMRKRNETFAEHEKELADRIAAAEAELELRTKELQNASRRERNELQERYRKQIKELKTDLRNVQSEANKELEVERRTFEARQQELLNHERTLHECMLKQEKHHSEVVRHLVERHGMQVQELQERVIKQHREHGIVVRDFLERQIEAERNHHRRETALLMAHYQAIGCMSLADQVNSFRANFSHMESNHVQWIGDMKLAMDDYQIMNIGMARGSLSALDKSIVQLTTSQNSLLAVLDRESSVPLETRLKLRAGSHFDLITGLASPLAEYSKCTNILSRKMSINPPSVISEMMLEQLESCFEMITLSVRNIPLLAVGGDLAQITHNNTNGMDALIGELNRMEAIQAAKE